MCTVFKGCSRPISGHLTWQQVFIKFAVFKISCPFDMISPNVYDLLIIMNKLALNFQQIFSSAVSRLVGPIGTRWNVLCWVKSWFLNGKAEADAYKTWAPRARWFASFAHNYAYEPISLILCASVGLKLLVHNHKASLTTCSKYANLFVVWVMCQSHCDEDLMSLFVI